MKRRCVPLRADHDLLTPDTHTVLGVSRHPVEQVRSGGVACLSEHLSNLSDSQFATKSSRRFPAVSTTRRLRFEDETETEAESRYLERQRQRRRGVLVSKPDLNLYVNGGEGTEPQGAGRVSNRQQRGGAGQCVTCQSDLKLCLNPPVPVERGRSLYRPRLNLRTEPIRESYIGSVTPADTSGGGGSAGRDANNQVRRKTNGNRTTIPQASPAADLPINPYAPNLLTTNTLRCPSSLSPPPVTSSLTSQSINGQKEEQRSSAAPLTDRNLQASVERAGRSPGGELKKSSSSSSSSGRSLGGESKKSSSSSSSGRSPSNTAERQAPPPSDSCRQPMRAALHSDETLSLLEYVINRDESSRLSLRRLLSSVRLSGTRTSSLDRLCSRPRPSVSEPTYSCPGKTSGVPKKMPSVPPLNVGTSFLQLRKSLSVESFGLEQKKTDRSADYRPAADHLPSCLSLRFLQRCLSIEDVGRPSSVRSVGRVLQVCSDGTFLLEVSQPKNRIYGFIISRGRGRPDSGVYVEDMVDSSTEKLYAGLLAVGDEILEVNGEKVACLSLDQVTHLLTQNTSATIRTLRHRPTNRGHLPPPDHLTT